MRFSTIIAGSLLTTGVALSACQSENIEIPKSELYTREFIKEFGIADPNHDWNNASQGTVTVVTSSPTHVEVLAEIKGKRYIFADYRKVTGTETINFTIPKGINNIIVTLNGREVPTTLGATVNDTSRSRAIWDDKTKDPLVKISRSPYREISDKAVRSFGEYLPEDEDNRGKVTQNFSYVANGPFTVYPIFWNTNSYNTLGIYYLKNEGTDDEKMVYVPFYTHKIKREGTSDGNLEYLPKEFYFEGYPAQTLSGNHDIYIATWNPGWEHINGKDKISDFTEEDWKAFEEKFIANGPGKCGLNLSNEYYNFPQDVKDKVIITDFKYSFDVEQNKITVTEVQTSEVEPFLRNYSDNDWVYPGTSQCSMPDYTEYRAEFDKGLKYDEIVANGFKPYPKWRSEGIHIDIEKGTKFGMFIRQQGNAPTEESIQVREVDMIYDPERGYKMPSEDDESFKRMFSQSKYNRDDMADSDNPTITVPAVHAATYIYPAPSGINYQVLGFEDWFNGPSNNLDLNDMVFFIDSENPLDIPEIKDEDKPEPEKYNYIIAAEDLGGTCDWDFNDLVIGVNVVSKNYVEAEEGVEGSTPSLPYKEVTVTPLASGGTLPIYLMYTGKVSTSQSDYNASVLNYLIGREFHAWLSNAQDAPLTPINVGANASTTGEPITFHIPDENYTLAMHDKYSASDDGTNNMGGFWVLVINQNDTPYTPAITDGKGLNQITDIPEGKGITRIEAPRPDLNMGNFAPQMLCIDHEWFWPREGKKIHLAYPASSGPGFEGWVNDPTVQGTWYGEGKYVESLVTKRPL